MKSIFALSIWLFISFSSISQDTLKVGEVYDFEIGDELHYRTTVYELKGASIERVYIKDKWYSSSFDTVFYKRDINFYASFFGNPEVNAGWYSDTIYYTELDKFAWVYDGNEDLCENLEVCILTIEQDTFCDLEMMEVKRRTGIIDFEEDLLLLRYSPSLGRLERTTFSDSGISGQTTRLIYYKRGTEDCGIPDYTTNAKDLLEESKSLLIYPNPVNDKLYVETSVHTNQRRFFDVIGLNGHTILKGELEKDQSFIDTSNLQAGLYFFRMIDQSLMSSSASFIKY